MEELEIAMKDKSYDIVGLSEIRRVGEAVLEKQNGDLFSFVGETKGQRGVGFLVNKRVKNYVEGVLGISERITLLKLKIFLTRITIIQVYAPTEASSQEELDEFYEVLDDTLNNHQSQMNFVIGDFNAKVGKKLHQDEEAIGNFGWGKRNNAGQRLVQFAEGQKLKVANTFFKNNPEAKWTWCSPNGKTRNEIDYILTNHIHNVQKLTTVNDLKFDSDHRMVISEIRLSRKLILQQKKKVSHLNINTEKFNKAIEIAMGESQGSDSLEVQQCYKELEHIILSAHERSLPPKNATQKKAKLSDNTLLLIEQRETLKTRRFKSEEKRIEYAEFNKFVKREIRNDLRKYKTDLVMKVMESSKSVKSIRRQLAPGRHWILGVERKDGTKCASRKDIVDNATIFYKELYASPVCNSISILRGANEESVPPILISEVRTAVMELKPGKTPGEDGILTEHLKIGLPVLAPKITRVFNKIMETEEIPEQWLSNVIILIHKKGSRNDLNNYRPITLMSNLYKLFSKIIVRRLTKTLDEEQPQEQAGFRSKFSTSDHLQTLNQVVEKTREHNLKLYMAFIDFKKAFDSVEQVAVLQALKKQGVHDKYIRLLNKINVMSYAKVRTEREGEAFPLKRGVRQGDPLSPKLFTCVLEDIFRKVDWKPKFGIPINGRQLTNLRFADDIVLFAKSAQDLSDMMQELIKVCQEAGLTINVSKTKVMTNYQELPILVNGKQVNYVHEYLYLGQLVTFTRRGDKEINRRISLAWNKFWSLSFIFQDKKLKLRTKRDVMDTCVLPVLLYGAQTWSLTEKQKNMLRICQRKMERKILHISLKDRIRNSEIRQRTGILDAVSRATDIKWKWGGHLMRMEQQRWAQAATVWDPRGGWRRRGRQETRWSDCFKKSVGAVWSRVAKNREEWKNLSHSQNQ